MRRRRKEASAGHGEPPAWLPTFTPADWPVDLAPPHYVDTGNPEEVATFRAMGARRRWQDAGRAWVAEHGHEPSTWYSLTRPGPAVDAGPHTEGADQ